MTEVYNFSRELEKQFNGQIELRPFNIFFDDPSEISDLTDTIAWSGLKLPVVFIGDEPVLTGYIDEPTVSQLLIERGLVKVA